MPPSTRPGINGYMLVTAVSWALNFVALKFVYPFLSPPALALLRWVPMAALLAAFCLLQRVPLRYPKGEAGRFLLLGFVSMGVYMVFFLEGMKGSTPGEGAIILATAPVMTLLLEGVFGMARLNGRVLLGAALAFAGVVLVALGQPKLGHGDLLSNGLVFVSAVVWAGSGILTRTLAGRYTPLQIMTLQMPGALPVLIPYGLAATLSSDLGRVSPGGWLAFAHISVMSGFVAFLCFTKAVEQLGAGGAMMYQYLVPPMAAAFGYLLLGTTLGPLQVAGFAVVVGGVVLASRSRDVVHNGAPAPGPARREEP